MLTEISGWLQSGPMSSVAAGHYFRVTKNNFHIPLHRAEEVMKGLWSFRIKLPHTERPSLAQQGPADQHYLNHIDKTDVLLKEAPDAAL